MTSLAGSRKPDFPIAAVCSLIRGAKFVAEGVTN